jgi:hypothetical protein
MNPPLKGQPVTAADCDAEWIALRREIVTREGRAVRAGAGNSIDVATLRPGDAWATLTLPNEATQFTTAAERDAVLLQLQTPLQ